MNRSSKTHRLFVIALLLCVALFSGIAQAQTSGDMAFIPAGSFVMGHGDRPPLGPRRKVTLKAFYIDRTEVTLGAYRKCAEAGKCMINAEIDNPNFDNDDYPVTLVSWNDAASYCAFAGKRLPTEAEWERAARGAEGRTYPWGEQKPGGRANFDASTPDKKHRFVYPAASFPKGATPEGVYDLAGNVAEWTADAYIADYHARTATTDPKGPPQGLTRTVRGGDFRSDFEKIRAFERDGNRTEPSRGYRLGFRCAKDAE